MSSLRDELTRTLLRLSRIGTPRPQPAPGPLPAQLTNYEGTRIGRYNVIRALGAGGMGHVYLAMDTDMGRHVALKFLSPDLVDDPEMLRRLRSEGLTASSLNHPNILTIYEIGEYGSQQFIATEYVAGTTLREAMQRNLIDLPTALDIMTQIASALVAAHAAGIIHRDLKPGNIMIREDGYVKVIDFGLAKHIRRSPRRRTADLYATRPGTIVGTVHYMSPEQASGDEIDGRSDIWSLGVILFELVTHRLPFNGLTETEVLENIRATAIPELPSDAALMPGVHEILHRTLQKDPSERYQTARDLLAALGAVHRPAAHHSPRPMSLRRRARPWLNFIAAAAVLLVIAAVWQFGLRDTLFGPNWFQIDKVRQLTFNGRVTLSCLSPDGKYLAYVAGDPEGLQTLYLSQWNAASEQIKIPPRKLTYFGVTFSPDNEIYAVSEGADLMGKLYVIPLVGEAPEKPTLVDIDGPVSFSPTGDRFAFVRYIPVVRNGQDLTENAIFVANRNGSGVHKLTSTLDAAIFHQLAWSPFNDQIAATYSPYLEGRAGQPTLHLIGLDGSSKTIPLPGWSLINQPWWNDPHSLILSSTAQVEWSGQRQLRQLDLRNARSHELTRDLAGYQSASLSADRSLLAAVKTESRGSLWVSASNNFSRGQTSLAEVSKFPSLSWISTDRVIVNSLRGGYPNLWQIDVNALTRSSFTAESFAEQEAIPVPGSRLVVLSSNRTGQFKIWKFDPDTNEFAQLTFGPNYDQSPTVSPDGRWIIYTSWYSNNCHLRRVPVAGGASEPFGAFPAKDPQFSPDGKRIACYIKVKDSYSVAMLPSDNPLAAPLALPQASMPIAWAPDGQSLHSVITDVRGVSNIWSIPLDGSAPRQVTSFEDQRIVKFAWSPAGDRLACLRASFGSDVALFTRAK